MLPKTINRDTDDHFVLAGRKGGRLFLVFVSRKASGKTLYVRECGNRATLEALQRWFTMRHDRWQAWAELAEAIGEEAFHNHMEAALAAEPPELVAGTSIRPLDDPREIAIDEVFQAAGGLRGETLHVHSFPSSEMRSHFLHLCQSDGSDRIGEKVLTIGWSEGSDALGRLLDQMAADAAARGLDVDGRNRTRH